MNMDILGNDAFTLVEMTDAIENIPYKPSFLRDMGLFEPQPVRGRTVELESRDGQIGLVQTTALGAPLPTVTDGKRKLRSHETSRIALADRLNASEIDSMRAFGKDSELATMQEELMRRIIILQDFIELTEENMRLGAIQGIVTDADGTVIVNWFDFFGITQATEVNFDLVNATTAAFVKNCKGIVRTMSKKGGGAFTPSTEIIAVCGDDFYDDLTARDDVRGNTITPSEAERLSNEFGNAYSAIKHNQIIWVNYRGTDDDSTVAIGVDKVKFFPKGARGVFKHATSPGESFDYAGTLGKDRYALTLPDNSGRNAFVDVEMYTYPLFYCTRPEMLLSGRRA